MVVRRKQEREALESEKSGDSSLQADLDALRKKEKEELIAARLVKIREAHAFKARKLESEKRKENGDEKSQKDERKLEFERRRQINREKINKKKQMFKSMGKDYDEYEEEEEEEHYTFKGRVYISEDSSDDEEESDMKVRFNLYMIVKYYCNVFYLPNKYFLSFKDLNALADRRSRVLAHMNDSPESELVTIPGFMKKKVTTYILQL